MANVLVSIGSNQDREKNITASLDALSRSFGELALSSIYESESVGFKGDNFLNLVAQFETDLSVAELSAYLKRLEDENGRCRTDPKFSGRTLDVDILTYDELTGDCDGINLPRGEILYHAFVLWPLAELVPNSCHPVTGESYQSLWQAFDKSSQKLWTIDFTWQGKLVSKQ